jgi:hypothetical protein
MPFFKCSKCERVWQYPLSECPFCLSELKKMPAEKSKVVSVSKVSMPTIRHPQIPYFSAIIEDENQNKWVHKSINEINEGDELVFEKTTDKNAVAIWRFKYDYEEAFSKAIELIGGLNLSGDSKVLILPSLFSANHPYFRENTSPQLLTGVLEFLKNKGVANIKIASQSFSELPIEAMADKSGLLKACLENNITPIDLSKTNFVKQGEFEISEEVQNADIVLNLGMLKAGSAKATENIFRVLKKENYLGQKYLKSEKQIATEMVGVLPNMISIGEAEYIQDREGFISFLGLIFASYNPLNLDRIFNEAIKEEKLSDILDGIEASNIQTAGRNLKELQIDIKRI